MNARGDIAGPVLVGGPSLEPQVNVLIDDGYSSTPPLGELLRGRRHQRRRSHGRLPGALPQDTYSNTWVGTGYVMDGPAVPPGFTDPNVVPTAFWFGRDQDNPNVLPFSSDAGDTLATATVTGLGPGTSSGTYTDSIWNALYGTKDVDLFSFQASKGMGLTATTSLPASWRFYGYHAPAVRCQRQ